MESIENKENANHRRVCMLMALACICTLVLAPFIGCAETSSPFVFWQIRVPRVIAGFLAGAGLSLCGACYQGLFRNPLATPYTLGVSGGAALGVALLTRVRFWLGGALDGCPLAVAAFAGAMLSVALVGMLVRLRRHSGDVVLLAGVAVSFLFSSLIMFLQYLGTQGEVTQVLRWLMGSLDVYGYSRVAVLAVFTLAGTAVICCNLDALNLLAVGDEFAASHGVSVTRTSWILHCAVSVTMAGVVSICGPIGFVGMIMPHVGRMLLGANHRRLAPVSMLLGGAFLVACDTLARWACQPSELPVGIITALLGGPFFLWLLLKR